MNNYAYLAGLIDAEGCLMLKKKLRQHGKTYTYQPCIEIGMTDEWMLKWVATLFPRRIYAVKRKDKPHYKTMYYLRYMSQQSREILKTVYPFLSVKREQADILLKVLTTKDERPARWTSRQEEYESLKQKITHLKKKHNNDYLVLPLPLVFDNQENELSYLGGLIDGDGGLGIWHNQVTRPDRNNKIYNQKFRQLKIEMNQPEGMLILAKRYGVKIHKNQKAPTFCVYLFGQNLRLALQDLLPYLKLKKESAMKVLESYEKTQPS
jgi:hypothetical protein